ncbi:MAG: hypothetical protein JJ971_03055 [Balneolaceae bacterium]|nr:hypothetical protein [Balneolaceae bacterium]MBO6545350.1 hypothetical protein [Balneolaceae bacterium]MBO6646746.1 hypothetical protein [Balneolaceae bacterium]
MGLLFFGTGLFIILAAADIIPIDEDGLNAPRWVLALCGLVFSIAGIMIFLGEHSKWNNLFAAVLILAMGGIGAWIALFGASENLSGGIPLLSDSANTFLARWIFGAGALVCFAIALHAIRLHSTSKEK